MIREMLPPIMLRDGKFKSPDEWHAALREIEKMKPTHFDFYQRFCDADQTGFDVIVTAPDFDKRSMGRPLHISQYVKTTKSYYHKFIAELAAMPFPESKAFFDLWRYARSPYKSAQQVYTDLKAYKAKEKEKAS